MSRSVVPATIAILLATSGVATAQQILNPNGTAIYVPPPGYSTWGQTPIAPNYVYSGGPQGYDPRLDPRNDPRYQQQQPELANAAQPQQTFGTTERGVSGSQTTIMAAPSSQVDLSNSSSAAGSAANRAPLSAGSLSRDQVLDPSSPIYRTDLGARSAMANQAYAFGVRAGYTAEVESLNKTAESRATTLDKQYDFRALMLSQYVVPPVVTELDDVKIPTDAGARTMLLTLGSFAIKREPRFSASPPNWRTYLIGDAAKVYPPSPSKEMTKDDKEIWKQRAAIGWDVGVRQAREAFAAQFAMLARDYAGMRRYHRLADEGALTVLGVDRASAAQTISRNGRRSNVGVNVLRLVALPRFAAGKPAARDDGATVRVRSSRTIKSASK